MNPNIQALPLDSFFDVETRERSKSDHHHFKKKVRTSVLKELFLEDLELEEFIATH